ncbi:hypothetical protein GN956_G20700 [Arapaima gigas]
MKINVANEIQEDIKLYKTLFESNVDSLRKQIKALREVADSMESVHWKATLGSLTGGVVGAAGGITSIVGIALAPFTLGTSLVVTGVGIGTAVVGGATSAVSNITDMVNKSKDRKTIETILKDYEDLMKPIKKCLDNLVEKIETLQKLNTLKEKYQKSSSNSDLILQAGTHLARGLGGVPEVVRLVNVVNMGKVASQAAKAVRVAEVFTGVLAGLFLALDAYFIAQDAKEIHSMRQTNSDPAAQTKSDTVKFIAEMRKTAEELEKGLEEIKDMVGMINKYVEE